MIVDWKHPAFSVVSRIFCPMVGDYCIHSRDFKSMPVSIDLPAAGTVSIDIVVCSERKKVPLTFEFGFESEEALLVFLLRYQ